MNIDLERSRKMAALHKYELALGCMEVRKGMGPLNATDIVQQISWDDLETLMTHAISGLRSELYE